MNKGGNQTNGPGDKKLMTMQKVLNMRNDIEILYVPRKEERRGLARIQDNMDTSIRGLEDNINKNEKKLITVANNSTDNIKINMQQ